MATLRDIRRRISAVSNTSKITQALKMISAAKMKRAQDAIMNARPYVGKLESMMSNLIEAVGEEYSHPLAMQKKEVHNVAAIIITSDRGMCGSFNTNIIRASLNYIRTTLPSEYRGAKISVIPVGKKACSGYRKEKYHKLKEFPGVFTPLNFSSAKDISSIIKYGYMNGEIDRVLIFYNEFVNVIKQRPISKVLLPIEPKAVTEKSAETSFRADYIFEPNQSSILDELLPKLIDIQIWRTMLESNAAEQAARMMAMDNATTNAKELIRHLELVYNKARQASITKEMLEIVSGADALKKSA
ncbi:MAG: synthase gamma chain [Bacteroidota bacterium]|nr:synthase gamma chain [Bacteroidota bacterium]